VDQIESLSDLQRPELDTPPPPPPATVDPTNRPSIDGVRAEVPKVEVDLDIGTGFNPDRDAQPLVRIPPQYPERCQARAKSLEFVIVQFDVDTQGVPQNIQVVEASSSCFNRAAVRSVERWKYQPKIVDGNPEWRRGVVQRISFQLSD
ncbi:MAG: energy transducer TonB, partial [Pseudomonadota bacterium]